MSVFNKNAYRIKKEAFYREYRRVEPYKATTSGGEPKEPRRKLTEDLELREEYKRDLVRTYNEAVDYLDSVSKDPKADKLDIQLKVVEILTKLKDSFNILNLTYDFETNVYAKIDINKIIEDPIDDPSDNTQSIDNPSDSHSQSESEISEKQTESATQNQISDSQTTLYDLNQTLTMPQSKLDFLQACHAAIDYKYDGDPTGLETFIDAIDLLDEVCDTDNKPTLLKFIMTRLEGKAREAIMNTPTKPSDITGQLKKSIKNESSKVIQGKMLALRAERTNLTKFSDRAEELAEQYRRSLVDEGYAKDKAKELSVEKTVELCIKQSRHDRLKSILASKTFSEPKDVIAKMIIEINNLRMDVQSSSNSNKNGNQNRSGRNFQNNRSSRSNGQNYNNNFSQNRGSNNNRSGNSNNSNNRSNYNNNGNNNRNGQNNYSQGQGRTFTNNNFRRGNEQSVRIVSGNSMNPGNGGETTDN